MIIRFRSLSLLFVAARFLPGDSSVTSVNSG